MQSPLICTTIIPPAQGSCALSRPEYVTKKGPTPPAALCITVNRARTTAWNAGLPVVRKAACVLPISAALATRISVFPPAPTVKTAAVSSTECTYNERLEPPTRHRFQPTPFLPLHFESTRRSPQGYSGPRQQQRGGSLLSELSAMQRSAQLS